MVTKFSISAIYSAFLFLKHLFTLKTLPILFYHRKQKISTKTLEKGFFNSA